MTAYVIAQIEVRDPKLFAEYREKVVPTVERYGGRYRALGGDVETLEGPPPASRVAVIEFDDMEAARRWYGSEEYAPLIALRRSAVEGSVFIVGSGSAQAQAGA